MHREWIDKGQIWLFMRDWTKSKYTKQYNYPDHPVASVEFDLGKPQDVEDFILDNLNQLIKFENVDDNDLPLCTTEERWNNGDTWAVIEKGKKRALKVFDSQIDANYMATRLTAEGSDVTIEERKGIDKKCIDYCSVNSYCDYFNKTYVIGKSK
jgi:hypothetical protein